MLTSVSARSFVYRGIERQSTSWRPTGSAACHAGQRCHRYHAAARSLSRARPSHRSDGRRGRLEGTSMKRWVIGLAVLMAVGIAATAPLQARPVVTDPSPDIRQALLW